MVKHKWIDDDDCENIIPEFESYKYDKKNPGVEILSLSYQIPY